MDREKLVKDLLYQIRLGEDSGYEFINRSRMMDKRGEGVPVILNESEKLSGKRPEYQMVGEELQLTVYAAKKESYRD